MNRYDELVKYRFYSCPNCRKTKANPEDTRPFDVVRPNGCRYCADEYRKKCITCTDKLYL